jgi:hypothetical protein
MPSGKYRPDYDKDKELRVESQEFKETVKE